MDSSEIVQSAQEPVSNNTPKHCGVIFHLYNSATVNDERESKHSKENSTSTLVKTGLPDCADQLVTVEALYQMSSEPLCYNRHGYLA